MRHLLQRPVRMTNDLLRAELGDEPRTPLNEAVRQTLAARMPVMSAAARNRRCRTAQAGARHR